MKLSFLLLLSFVICGIVSPGNAGAVPVLFSDNLQGWTHDGVSASNGVATLMDDTGYAYLYQGIGATPGRHTLSFDFSSASAPVSGGSFSDLFAVSIYFNEFGGVAPEPLWLIDNTAGDLTIWNGVVGSSERGSGWLHFSTSFDLDSPATIIPSFELFDLNGINGDSSVRIAGLELGPMPVAPVPEPSTLLLVGSCLLGMLAFARRRREP